MKTLILTIALSAALLAQPNQLDLRQDPPVAVQSERVSSAYTGTSGATTYYYWVVTRYPIGFIVPTSPVVVGGASALGGGNSVALGWPAMTGASSYDVLRTTTNAAPSSCTCAVVLATTGTTLTDNGAALSAWPPGGLNSAGVAQAEFQINNRDAGAPYITMAVRNAQRTLNYQLGILKNGTAPSYVPGGFIQPYSNPQGALACVDSTGADCMATRPGPTNYCADVGAVNAYDCSLSPAITAYSVGNNYRFEAATANTGPATVDFGPGAVAIKTAAGADLAPGNIWAGQMVDVTYTGSVMQLQAWNGLDANNNLKLPGALTVGATIFMAAPSGGDDTATIAAAVATACASNPGAVVFSAGTYITSPITGCSNLSLQGAGISQTTLVLQTGSNDSLLSFVNKTYWSVRDLTLAGNYPNQTGTSHGIYQSNTSDPNFQIENVYIKDTLSNGLHLAGNWGAGTVSNLRVVGAQGIGVYTHAWDTHFEDIDVGNSGLQGIYQETGANQWTNVKTWLSGNVTPASGNGFQLAFAAGIGTSTQINGLFAQDNQACGVVVTGMGTVLIAVEANNNNLSSGTYAGICLSNASTSIVIGHSTALSDVPPEQAYGLSLASSINNIIRLTTDNNVSGMVNGAIGINDVNVVDADGTVVSNLNPFTMVQSAAASAIEISQNGAHSALQISTSAGAAGFYTAAMFAQDYGLYVKTVTDGGDAAVVQKDGTGTGRGLVVINKGTGDGIDVTNGTTTVFKVDKDGNVYMVGEACPSGQTAPITITDTGKLVKGSCT